MASLNIQAFSEDLKGLFPKSVIVLITAHGKIPLDSSRQPKLFEIPPEITLTTVSASPSGCCNFVGSDIMDAVALHLSKMDMSSANNIKTLERIATVLAEELKLTSRLTYAPKLSAEKIPFGLKIQDLQREWQSIHPEFKDDADYSDYKHQFGNIYNISSGLGEAINKSYEITPGDWVNPYNVNNRINIFIPPKGIVDYLLRPPNKDSIHTTSLETFLTYLKNMGVKHVLLIDLSCSIFMCENTGEVTNPREKRVLRRAIKTRKLGGKKAKQKKAHMHKRKKTRRHKSIKFIKHKIYKA